MDQMRGLWRGKSAVTGEWIKGTPCAEYMIIGVQREYCGDEAEMSEYPEFDYDEIDPSTLGECTGLRDKNGKLIFEGDRIKFIAINGGNERVGEVFWFAGSWYVNGSTQRGAELIYRLDYIVPGSVEIIGNSHDNSEQLKGADDNGVIKLKPCPFCGGEAMYSVINHGDGGMVYCTVCGICTTSALTGVPYTTYEAATAAWNRRVSEKEEN